MSLVKELKKHGHFGWASTVEAILNALDNSVSKIDDLQTEVQVRDVKIEELESKLKTLKGLKFKLKNIEDSTKAALDVIESVP